MCISNAPSCTTWTSFAPSKSWTLASGDGPKAMSVWLRDRVGNVTSGPIQAQILLDTTAPGNPTLTSSSHAVSTWSADRIVVIHWTGAGDAGGDVSGYSVRWDGKPSTVPDAVMDTVAQTSASASLSNGDKHYAHVRTVDKAGNWSATAAHLGPFFIDGTPPTNGTLTATAGPASVSLAWSRITDAASGLATTNPYRLVYRTSASPAARCTDGTAIFVGAAGRFQHQNLVPGTRYFYRLCASDKAGNVSMGATTSAV